MNVVCICTGTKYGPEYVERLQNGVRRHAKLFTVFNCLWETKFPGWWGKMDLFPPRERTVYFDLDVVITGNIDFIFEYGGPFCIWEDPWNGGYNGSVMSIAEGYGQKLRDAFLADPEKAMREFRSDQEFIRYHAPHADTWPKSGKIKSYKADHLEDGPGDAAVVVFHGEPKPHEFTDGWVKEMWR